MFSTIRAASAAVLACALIASPLALDRCSAFCEMHHDAVTSTPSCHHTASTAMRFGRAPAPCGHDHNATSARIAAGLVTLERVVHSAIADLIAPADMSDASRELVFTQRLPDNSSTSHDRSLPLRI
jgi:hypothetical protein